MHRGPRSSPPTPLAAPTGVAALRPIDGALALLVVGLPFVVLPNGADAFRLPRDLAAGWLMLACGLLAGLEGGDRTVGWRRNRALLALAPLALVNLLGFVLAPVGPAAARALAGTLISLAAPVLWVAFVPAAVLARLFRALLVPAVVLALLVLAEAAVGNGPIDWVETRHARENLGALAGNPGDLGAFLAVGAIAALWVLRRAERPPARWFAGAALGLVVCGLAATATATAIVALLVLAVALAVWAAGGQERFAAGPRAPRPRRLWSMAALVGALTLLATLLLPATRERLGAKLERAARGELAAALSSRPDGWRVAWWLARHHLWTGVGPAGFEARYLDAKEDILDAGGAPFTSDRVFASAHSEPLELLATSGLPGLAAGAWACFTLVAAIRRRLALDRHGQEAGVQLAILTVAGVLSLTYFPFRLSLVGVPLLLGLAWIWRSDAEVSPPPRRPDQGSGVAVRGWQRAGLVATSAAALLLWSHQAVGRLKAQQRVALIERSVAQGIARGGLPGASLAALRQHAARAVAEDPLAANAWIASGTLALLAGDAETALDAYLVAQRSGRRPEIHLGLARAHRQRGDDAAAQHEMRKLRRLAPRLRRELARWDGRLGPHGEVPWDRLRRSRPQAPAR